MRLNYHSISLFKNAELPGPLLWHWENNTSNDPSIELDLEQVKQLAREIGFEISHERTIDTTYTNNAQSMLGYVYHTSFWVAVKKEENPSHF